jgi:hypothetical protein
LKKVTISKLGRKKKEFTGPNRSAKDRVLRIDTW